MGNLEADLEQMNKSLITADNGKDIFRLPQIYLLNR
jgi:hypothetical protein